MAFDPFRMNQAIEGFGQNALQRAMTMQQMARQQKMDEQNTQQNALASRYREMQMAQMQQQQEQQDATQGAMGGVYGNTDYLGTDPAMFQQRSGELLGEMQRQYPQADLNALSTAAQQFQPPDPYAGLSGDFKNMAIAGGRVPSWQEYQADKERQAKAGATNVTTNIAGPTTPGQKKVDENFAQEYVDFVASGGYADTRKGIEQLKEVVAALETESWLTGPVVGNVPDSLKDIVTPRAQATKEAVEEVVQRNLRLVLGAQFTAQEGERLISRAYNPKLPQKENIKRVNRLVRQIETAALAKADAAKYFEENGTLTGWKGKVYTVNDFMSGSVPVSKTEGGAESQPVSGAKQAPDGNWYVERGGKFFRVEK